MADLVTCVVDPGGTGNYTSLNAAEAGAFTLGAGNEDLVTQNKYIECTCKCTNGAADTTPVTISGWTTDSTHDITISVHSDYRHSGKWVDSGNVYRMDVSLVAITSDTAYVEIGYFLVRITPSGINKYAFYLQGDNNIAYNCVAVAQNVGSLTSIRGFYGRNNTSAGTKTIKFKNCIAYNMGANAGNYGFVGYSNTGSALNLFIYNCVSIRNSYGFILLAGSVTLTVKNCITFDCYTDGFSGAFDASSTNNASDYDDAPGSNAIALSSYSASDIFADPDNDDYRPKAPNGVSANDSPIYRAGANLYSDGDLAVTDDILGNSRSASINFDVGAFQLQTQSRVVYVDPGGTGDYTSLNAAEAANFGGDADLVTYDETRTCWCRCTNGSSDTTAVTISGQTTDSTHDITIDVEEAYRHKVVWPSSGNVYRIEVSGTNGFAILVPYVSVAHIAVKVSGTTGTLKAFYANSTETYFSSCFGQLSGSGLTPWVFYAYNTTDGVTIKTYFSNCIAVTFAGYGFRNYLSGTGSIITYVYNFTSVGAATGIRDAVGSSIIAKNCLVFDSVDGFAGTFDAASTNNASDTGDAPGSNDVDLSGVDADDLFVDYDNNDFHLVNPYTAVSKQGVNLSGDIDFPITDDIDGTTRPPCGPWDIGADQWSIDQPNTRWPNAGGIAYPVDPAYDTSKRRKRRQKDLLERLVPPKRNPPQ